MKKYHLYACAIATCIALGSQQAFAAKGFDYTYAEAGYRNIDGDSISGDGFNVGFSFGATDLIHIDGRYSRLFIDDMPGVSNVDLDANEFKIGLGGHFAVTDSIDVLATVRYVDLQLSGNTAGTGGNLTTTVNDYEEGFEVEAGARARLGKGLELDPRVIYLESGGDSDTGVGVGVVYDLDKTFALTGGINYFSDDSETDIFAGMRIDF